MPFLSRADPCGLYSSTELIHDTDSHGTESLATSGLDTRDIESERLILPYHSRDPSLSTARNFTSVDI